MTVTAKTLYLTTHGTNVKLDADAARVERPGHPFVRIPLRRLDTVVAHGHIHFTSQFLTRCAADHINVVFLTRSGRFAARVQGPTTGNVYLRQAQYRALDDPAATRRIATAIVTAKLLNSRTVLLDYAKDHPERAQDLRVAAQQLERLARQTAAATTLNQLRGIEGQGASVYFDHYGQLPAQPAFQFKHRSRRPPRDPMNALLSYLYALLRIRCVGAAETVGLDPQAGFLHGLRAGRPALALDLLEEFRALLADHHALTLVNRRQLTTTHLIERLGGSWELTDDGRSVVLRTWDTALDTTVRHRVLGSVVARRQLPHLQAQLLARHLRGDLPDYVPFRQTGR